MNLKIIKHSILPLILATLFIIIFNWQFPHSYNYLIEHFSTEKLSTLYAHLFIYNFLVLLFFISWINIFNYFILKSKVFVSVSIVSIFIFYILSHSVIIDSFQYFIHYPLSTNTIMGMVFFSIGTIGYGLYSLAYLFVKHTIPLSHIIVFTLLGTFYALGFIDVHCYPVSEILIKLL